MKQLFVVVIVFFSSQIASADIMLRFNDGTANVWESYYAKGAQYCTVKPSFGEYCVQKSDVVSIKEVPAGTEASVYGITSGGDPELTEKRREENSAALKSLNCTQLMAAKTKAAMAQYRNECFTPEEKNAWNEKVRRDEERRREVLRYAREIQRDSDRAWKERERDDKIDRIDRTLRGW